MAAGKVLVGVPAFDQGSRLVRPFLIAEAVEIVAQIVSDVRKSAQPRDGVMDVAPLVFAARRRLSVVRGNILNHRDDHVALAREM